MSASNARAALLCMGGVGASARGPVVKKSHASGAATATEKPDDSDVLDIHVKKGSSFFWPFVLGVGAGVGGSIFVYKLLKE